MKLIRRTIADTKIMRRQGNNSENQSPITAQAQSFHLAGHDAGIVLIHGYGGSIGDYRRLAEQLHAFGYSVSGLRLAGHGQGQEALRQSTVADCQRSVAEAVSDIRRTCRQVFLLGSSFGGVLALDYAEHHQDVNGLVLVNTALAYSGAGIFQGLILRLMNFFTPDYPKQGLTTEEKHQAALVGSSPAWPISGILATSRFARRDVIPKLSSVCIPALILHSQDDSVVGPANSRKLANLIGSSTKEIQQIPVATHRPFRHPEATAFIAERMHRFISAVIAKD